MVIFGASCCNREKVVVFGKVAVFGQTWFYSGKVVVFGQNGCIREQVV